MIHEMVENASKGNVLIVIVCAIDAEKLYISG